MTHESRVGLLVLLDVARAPAIGGGAARNPGNAVTHATDEAHTDHKILDGIGSDE